MKLKILPITLICLSILLAACSNEKSVTTIIRVTHGNPPQPEAGEFALNNQEDIIQSYNFLSHVAEKLDLPKIWNLSEDKTVSKLRDAITVQSGSEPGLFVITAKGNDRDISVKILNELCVFYTSQKISISGNADSTQILNIMIVQSAK